ncbi:MAG: M48 family metallopeptidase [Rhodothermaceae bacterium]
MELQGIYFNGKISKAASSVLKFDEYNFYVCSLNGNELLRYPTGDVVVNKLIGKNNLIFEFKSGEVFESGTSVPEEFYALQKRLNKPNWIITFLENNLFIAYLGLIIFAATLFSGYFWGLPLIAEKSASQIPMELLKTVDEQSLSALEYIYFEESELKISKKKKVEEIFEKTVENAEVSNQYSLHIKSSDKLGPNAFALPGGSIVITDDLINLADDLEDLEGVFAHEIAHVEKRHGIRNLIQNAGVFVMFSTIMGDYSSITSSSATIPLLIIETGYSRDFEREADTFAANYLLKTKGSAASFKNILSKLTEHNESSGESSMLSTHPGSKERIKLIREIQESFINKN